MKKLMILCFSFAFFGCSTVKVLYDYDRETDFTTFKTYEFSAESHQLGVGDLNQDRIIKAVDSEMAAKGFSKSSDPDVLVDLHVKSERKVEATAYTSGMGGPWRYGYGGGFTTTQVSYNEYTEGTLFINLVDVSTEKIVWQGTGTKTLSENSNAEKRDENISYGVQQIFANYPPESQGIQ